MKSVIVVISGAVVVLVAIVSRLLLVYPMQQDLYSLQEQVSELEIILTDAEQATARLDDLNLSICGVDSFKLDRANELICELLRDVFSDSSIDSAALSKYPGFLDTFYEELYIGHTLTLQSVTTVPVNGDRFYAVVSWDNGATSCNAFILFELQSSADSLNIIEAHAVIR